jgi:pyocin large subunit-like protein
MKDEIGRFITVDPVGPVDPRTSKTNYSMLLNPQSLNRYAYGLNSPYKYVDPDGRIVQLIVPVLVAFGLIEFGEHAFPQTMGSSQRDSFIDQHGTDLMMMALPIENVGGRLVEKAVEGARLAKWGLPETLARHFKDHGADFGAKSAEEYASMASDFLARAQKGKLPTKISQEGTIRVYEPSTNTFGSYNPDGTTRTFYKPTQGQRYWERQPGKEPWTP